MVRDIPLFFNIAAVLLVALQQLSEDSDTIAELVHLRNNRRGLAPDTAMECVCRAVFYSVDPVNLFSFVSAWMDISYLSKGHA